MGPGDGGGHQRCPYQVGSMGCLLYLHGWLIFGCGKYIGKNYQSHGEWFAGLHETNCLEISYLTFKLLQIGE